MSFKQNKRSSRENREDKKVSHTVLSWSDSHAIWSDSHTTLHVAMATDAAVPPWVGYNEEEQMKAQILELSAVSSILSTLAVAHVIESTRLPKQFFFTQCKKKAVEWSLGIRATVQI